MSPRQAGSLAFLVSVPGLLSASVLGRQETGPSFQTWPVASVLLECEGHAEGRSELTLGSLMAQNLGSGMTEIDLEASVPGQQLLMVPYGDQAVALHK